MTRFFEKISAFMQKAVFIIFLAIIIWLFLLSGFGMVAQNAVVQSYFIPLNMSFKLWLIAGIVLFFVIISKHKDSVFYKVFSWKYIEYIFIAIIFIAGIIFVCTAQVEPAIDQQFCWNSAKDFIAGNYGDFFNRGGYLDKWNHQLGLVLFDALFIKIFGDRYILFQILNVVALSVIHYEVCLLLRDMKLEKIWASLYMAVSLLFVPTFLYTTFVYGTLLGLMCALIAYRAYFKAVTLTENPIVNVIISASFFTISILLKKNYIVFLIGVACISVVYFLSNFENAKKKAIKSIIYVIVIFAVYFLVNAGMFAIIRKITGGSLSNGISSFSYIAMGISPDYYRTQGWYNGINEDCYFESDGSAAVQKAVAMSKIKESVSYYLANKKECVSFFTHKIASEWNNPTFSGIWVNQAVGGKINSIPFYRRIISFEFAGKLGLFLNIIQFFILTGALFYAVSSMNETGNCLRWDFLFIVVFIGGFLLHILWEANAQYTLPYFVLLIPLSVLGYRRLTQSLTTKFEQYKNGDVIKISMIGKRYIITGCVVLFMCVLSFCSGMVKDIFRPDDNYDKYKKHMEFFTTANNAYIENGNYIIHPVMNMDKSITREGDHVFADDAPSVINIQRDHNTYLMQFDMEQNGFLNTYTNGEQTYNMELTMLSTRDGTKWKIELLPDGVVVIFMYDGYALTYDAESGDIRLNTRNNSEYQMWMLEKVD